MDPNTFDDQGTRRIIDTVRAHERRKEVKLIHHHQVSRKAPDLILARIGDDPITAATVIAPGEGTVVVRTLNSLGEYADAIDSAGDVITIDVKNHFTVESGTQVNCWVARDKETGETWLIAEDC